MGARKAQASQASDLAQSLWRCSEESRSPPFVDMLTSAPLPGDAGVYRCIGLMELAYKLFDSSGSLERMPLGWLLK